VRSDRGLEYMSGTSQQWFKGKGIQHDTSAPYTPQQNGAAERLNRTLAEKVRPMMLDAGLEECWWGETFVTAPLQPSSHSAPQRDALQALAQAAP
jgi:transposase InsO family protein